MHRRLIIWYSESANINCDIDIKMNNDQINRVKKATFLGIMIDEQLTWKEQTHQIQTSLSRNNWCDVYGRNCTITYTIHFTIRTYNGQLLRNLGKFFWEQAFETFAMCFASLNLHLSLKHNNKLFN